MNKAGVVARVSQKSGIAVDVCEKVIDAFEEQFGDILLKKIKGVKSDLADVAESISQKTGLASPDCEKVLAAFKEVVGEGLVDRLKFWK
ncbi:MAG: hypothetical protein FWG71_02255 [Synergistaceae bacterium]|nr:hypothetical protein [Synergistaceae bacterium]